MADGHHESFCGLCVGMDKRRNQLKSGTAISNHLQGLKKYITSIMDEGSSDNMDEAGIPMLVSEYNRAI